MARILAKDDPALVDIVRARLKDEGVDLREGVRVERVAAAPDGVAVAVTGLEERITGTHLLVATGRRPVIDGLDLDVAGIEHGATGIKVDARLRTSSRGVYALGDVSGGPQFTHMANYQAGIVLRNALFHLPAKVDTRALPWVTFTDPELAQVGLTESQARAERTAVRVLEWPLRDNDRAQAERLTEGLVKVVTDRHGRILGAGIVAARAGELIQPWILAMFRGLRIGALANMIVPYPTLGEVNKRAAGAYFAPLLFSPRTRRLVRLLGRLNL
jgi:pyruvate/2-oxoglutarate dehydrogenase complex dihydrolipoamide dehydrogenase (E3) component